MKSNFATRLKQLRVLRGLRQKDLASALGLAQTTIANYEQKLRFPDEPTLVRVADYFSVSLDHLLGRDDGSEPDTGVPAADSVADPADPLPGLAMEYFHSVRGDGREAARALLLRAIAEGTSVRELYLRVFSPALREVGRLWARGEMSVGEEHVFSEVTQQLMAELAAPGIASAAPVGPRCVVLAVGGEMHVIGARMVADFLSMAGCQVRFLGGNLSIGHALEMLRASPPDVLALSLTLREHMNPARDLIGAVRSHKDLAGVKIMVGGQAFSGHPHEEASLGADAAAGDAEDAVAVALRLAAR